ncbi:LOW QUALITY PROTEIN: hypothetical protein PHMEG_0009327 [Phytophthora megakarya]|uniref:Uncharacterized protein n=1 Tax=Phytophthora megakarya TaxID=4795 RepID=A0A225WIJ3_9STRA|nr:LOW QUALITY PROTEIN: hypothetical protein PHMEG_0009327 [Phytophthora megakarya]
MPTDKITTALNRVELITSQTKATKTELMKLLGSLRHVCTCIRSARPFYQCLQLMMQTASRFGHVELSVAAALDLRWFSNILQHGHLQNLPLAIFGNCSLVVDWNIYMDASNMGLAVLNPAVNEFIQRKFDADELSKINATSGTDEDDIYINVREHFATGAKVLGSCMAVLQQRTDNYCNFGQELTRVIGLGEAVFNIRVQAKHLPGFTHSAADAASQAWDPNFSDTWTNFCASWYQVEIPERLRRLYRNFSINFNPGQWPSVHESSTLKRGSNGSSGAIYWNTRCGFQPTQQSTHTSSIYLPLKFGWNNDGVGNAVTIILAKISHLSWHHQRVLGYPVGLMSGDRLAIVGMRRQDPSRSKKSPVTTAILRRMFKGSDSCAHLSVVQSCLDFQLSGGIG